jgi:uncharacterized Zn finger protein
LPTERCDRSRDKSFGRGEVYFADGAVRSLKRQAGGIKAVVVGTRTYRVRLRVEGGALDYDCTCPVGQDGDFCKHCVAVGLAWRADKGGGETTSRDDEPPPFSEDDLRDYLAGLDKEELVSLLLDRAEEDERLHRRLMVRAAHATPGTAELSVWKDALDDALETQGLVHYREAYDYASGIEEVIESLEELLRAERAEGVIELAEHGLEAVEQCLGNVDDSDGWMGGHLRRLQELHLEACRQARPNPVNLAERLFEWEMETSYDTFYRAAAVYADVLGETGLAAYRRLAEAEWAKVPALGPGDDDPERYGRRHRITSVMEAIAEASGDLDALVAVKSRDLSLPYAFLQIAQIYQDAGDPDLALDWAERGWRAFSDKRRDERLRAFIAEAYQGRGRQDEAMTLVWEAFAEYPSLETYRQLEQHARRVGQRPAWREKALALIRERIADRQAKPPGQPSWMRPPSRDHSLLVQILLHEGDPDGAWCEAETGGCSEGLWLVLAERRETSYPGDSVRVYKDHVAALLRNTGNSIYEEAVGFLEKIRTLLARSGQEAEFRPLLTEIRATHRRKRNLMKMLDGKGW